ncbi:MAG TPA: ferritin [Longimicrobiales bacterium]|nr:ferritin [Longimicrobiales bacterium]
MDEALQEAVNEQIRNELYSGYVYLAMAAHFEEQALSGFAHWMRLQAKEELGHGMRLFDYLLDRGGHVVLEAIDQPPTEWGTPLEIFRHALEHERKVTGMIDALYDLARDKQDNATQVALQWFITEQVEEEASAEQAVDQLQMAGDNAAALLMLDQKFGARTNAG